MRKVWVMAGRILLLTLASGVLISCASAATRGNAQDLGRAGDAAGASGTGPLKVLVLGEDGHDALIPRGDPAFRRVVAELQETMDRRGFRVVDEEAIAADHGWPARDYRDKTEVLEAAKLANASERAASRVQAALLFRIEGTYRDLRYATRIDLHLSGDLYDVRSNRFLGAVDLPAETVTVPGRCLTVACGSQAVSARARDLASELGLVLARKLAALAPPEAASPATVDARVLEAVYTVTFRHLSTEEALSVIDVMTDGFPGYRSHDLLRGGGAVRRYEYVTTASAEKIERWLTLLLVDMGLDPEREIVLAVRDGDIRIERVLPATAKTPE